MNEAGFSAALRRALRGHATYRFAALVLGFSFQVVVVKLLPPEQYATYAVLLAILLVGERLLSFGTDRSILRFVPALILRNDRTGIRILTMRLVRIRAIGIASFVIALMLVSTFQVDIVPGDLPLSTLAAFGLWFVAFSILKEGDAVAQSLIVHDRAAVVGAAEVLVRLCALLVMVLFFGPVNVHMVMMLHALTSTAAMAGLLGSIWAFIMRRTWAPVVADPPTDPAPLMPYQMPAFASAAYASTLSYLISSPGVIRLVARTGLDIYAFAAFSFVQGLASSIAGALPGQLVLPSLESVAAKLTDEGKQAKAFPMLSLLFKVELVLVMAIVVATTLAGAEAIGLLSRQVYAPYYYVLPALMLGLLCQTVYRLIEIIGSMHLKYRVFFGMWPLSVAAMIALYLTVGRWGMISVIIVPLLEISVRVGILLFAFRDRGIGEVLDARNSLRVLLTATVTLSALLLGLQTAGAVSAGARIAVAAGGTSTFLLLMLAVRPVNAREHETLCRVLPESWTMSRYIVARLRCSSASALS